MKIDFCPNKRRLILLSCPLQLISIDSRSPSGLRPCSVRGVCDICWVSIHAAQAGCDILLVLKRLSSQRFNSRSPSGLRQSNSMAIVQITMFQFTQPKRAATSFYVSPDGREVFQFTQPKRAATKFVERTIQPNARFNSRSPSGLRPESISPQLSLSLFQFTQPKRAATVP